jgi:AcrR family transcriptional regulator
MGKRSEQIVKQREKILNVSLKLFVQKSYHGTTVRDIARKAEISIGLLFHYFPTKEDILKELLRLSELGISNVLELLSLNENPLIVFEKVTKMVFESYSDENRRYLYLLVNQVITFDTIPIEIKKIRSFNKTIEASIPVIIKGQEKKIIKKGNPQALSLAFWGAIQGIAELLCWFPSSAVVPNYKDVVDILRLKT